MPDQPAIRVEPRTAPSRRHPNGLPRCRRVRKLEDGSLAQCRRVASWQLGSPVCGVHGGGWPVRVARGERRNPVTASLLNGRKARDQTINLAFAGRAESGDVPLQTAILGEYIRRVTDRLASHCRTQAEQFRTMWYGVNGRTRGRPSREDRSAQRELRAQLLYGSLYAPANAPKSG